jgi:hypothetical protein
MQRFKRITEAQKMQPFYFKTKRNTFKYRNRSRIQIPQWGAEGYDDMT